MILGTLIVITLYAIIKVSGLTIMFSLIPVILFFFLTDKTDADRSWIPLNFKIIGFILTCAGLHTLFYGYFFLPGTGVGFNHIFADHIIYARLANILNTSGREINPLDLAMAEFDPNFISFQPYHFPLLWFCAFASRITGLTEPVAFEMVVMPFMFTGISLGLLAMLTELKIKFSLGAIYSFLLVYFCGFDHRLLSWFTEKTIVWDYTLAGFGDGKLGPLMLLISWQGIFFIRQRWDYVLVLNVLICLFSITMLPSLALVSLIVLCLGFIDLDWRRMLPSLIVGIVCMVIFLMVYLQSVQSNHSVSDGNPVFPVLAFLKELRYNLVVSSFTLMPLVFAIGIYLWQQRASFFSWYKYFLRNQTFHLLLCILVGVLLFFILLDLPDRFQFIFVPRALMIPILSVFVLKVLHQKINSKLLSYSLLVILFTSFFSGLGKNIEVQFKSHPFFNNEFSKECIKLIGYEDKLLNVGLFSSKKTSSLFDNSFLINNFGMELVYYNPKVRFVNIGVLYDKSAWAFPEVIPFLDKMPLVKFYNKNIVPKDKKEIDEVVNKFIKKNRIKYILVEKNAITPNDLLLNSKNRLINSSNGDYLLILN